MTSESDDKAPQIIIYETNDKVARVSVRLDGETVWLTQQQLSELYGTSRPNVSMHIRNILASGELSEDAVCKKCLQTAADGKTFWLTQAQIVALFQTTPQNAISHLKAFFEENELDEDATCKDYLQVRLEGGREVSRNLA